MQFCTDCGKPLAPGKRFCGNCGAAVAESSLASAPAPSFAAPAPTFATGQVQQPAMPSENATASFIGRKYRYYEAKWATPRFLKSKRSWNWGAFFGGGFWFAYRKMYAYAWGIIGLIVLDALCQAVFHYSDSLTLPIFIGVGWVIGSFGNSFYKNHVDTAAAEIVATESGDNVRAELVRRGGTSIGAPFGFLALIIGIQCAFHPDLMRAFFQ